MNLCYILLIILIKLNMVDFDKNNIDIVLYHKNCMDGFGSAFVVWYWNKINNKYNANKIKYIGCSNRTKLPNSQSVHNTNKTIDIIGKNILICDFGFNYDIMKLIEEKSNSVLLIDHHKTTLDMFKDNPNFLINNKIIDMDKSGCYLTWEYFFGNNYVPKLIQYINDNDLWLKQMPYTLEYTAYLRNIDQTFENYELELDDNKINDSINIGKILLKSEVKIINNILLHTCIRFIKHNNIKYLIGTVNTNVLHSDIGNGMMKKYPIDFAICYNYDSNTNNSKFSLRSLDNRNDVSNIAKKYGGGGHRNASGMLLNNFNDCIPSKTLINNIHIDLYSLENKLSILKINDIVKYNKYKKSLCNHILNLNNKDDMDICIIYKLLNIDNNKIYNCILKYNYNINKNKLNKILDILNNIGNISGEYNKEFYEFTFDETNFRDFIDEIIKEFENN